MAIKKDTPIKFSKPMSTMHQVLNAVSVGFDHRRAIIAETGLNDGQVRSALWNLTFIGAIKRSENSEGHSVYRIPGLEIEVCQELKGVNSVFNPLLRIKITM